MNSPFCRLFRFGAAVLLVCLPASAQGQLQWGRPAQKSHALGIANLTNDYTVRDWAAYHNTESFSPNGRWLSYTRYASDGTRFGNDAAAEVRLVDLHTGADRLIGKGHSPRWANHNNWLFFLKPLPGRSDFQVIWLDLDADRLVPMGTGLSVLGETSYDDRWIFGALRQSGSGKSYRMPIRENAQAQYLPGMDNSWQWIPNPFYNVVFARVPNVDREVHPFAATRYWCDIDGSNIRIGAEVLTQSHQSWLGNGEYYLMGNFQVRGRKWNEPFPSSIHLLASVSTGDVSPAGRSGRFVVGDKPLTVADLRSGDGWRVMDDLSIICYTADVLDASGPYDSDPKGSPDGTKMVLVSNYDLINGLVTVITQSAPEDADRIEVESTEGFPETGEIVVHREVIGYSGKTPTSFEGLVHNKYNTSGFGGRAHSALSAGQSVTPFEARLIPEEEFKRLPLPAASIVRDVGGMDTPLVRQKSTDVYAVVIRLPDPPFLRAGTHGAELIPGESHHETFGYHLLRDGSRVTTAPLRPGATEPLSPGTYRAVAVEWSGLEGRASNEFRVTAPISLSVLHESPSDFSWTYDVWLVDGAEVDRSRALRSLEAVRQIQHRADGLISVETYNWGQIQQRHDLNEEGKAIRRLTYHQGHLFKREYHRSNGAHVSTEYLDPQGYVTEMILYRTSQGRQVEYDRWWYNKGMPERRIASPGARRITATEPVMYHRAGNQWIQADHVGEFIPAQDAIGPRSEWGRMGGASQ